jgi:hypothetical protein
MTRKKGKKARGKERWEKMQIRAKKAKRPGGSARLFFLSSMSSY